MAIDLHIHSNHSDGRLTPRQLVAKAARLGLKAIAVADHDTCSGAREAARYAKQFKIRVIPAVEVSAIHQSKVIHILGYFVNTRSRALVAKLDALRRDRISRAVKIIKRVNVLAKKRGRPAVDPKEFLEWAGKKEMIMRGDLAWFLFHKGFGKSPNDVFLNWLESTNIPVRGLSVREAIRAIHGAGGVAVLAHPNSASLGLRRFSQRIRDHQAIIAAFARYGLDGLEVKTPRTAKSVAAYYRKVADRLKIIPTAGSDFHGPHIPGARVLGAARAPDATYDELKKRSERYARDAR
ncbi:PHP domain-containing protein [Candidatus Uhrbacteria bacterium]|nr:PHP domain-containing protein [Candidatus Uhrbacteria bacterium]